MRKLLFSKLLKENAIKSSDKVAISDQVVSYTYSQLKKAVDLCAYDLIQQGVGKGDHVALWSSNSANWLVAFFGIIRAGGVAVLSNYGMPSEYLIPTLSHTDVKHIVVGHNHETMQREEAAEELGNAIGISRNHIYDIRSLNSSYLKRIENGESHLLPKDDRDVHDTAVIIFTSGTTGMPKAVQQSQCAILNNIYNTTQQVTGLMGDRFLLALPLFHSYGLELSLCYLCIQSTQYITPELKPDKLVDIIIDKKISDIFSVNILYAGITQQPKFEKEASELLTFCGVGGGFSAPIEIMRLAMLFPNASFFCGYGQTEACTIISVPCKGDSIEKCAYTVGKPIDGLDVKIFDATKGFVEQGETGEILIKGDSLMNGYYKLPKEEQAIDEDGWLHTGDLGYFDEDGYLHLSGRSKDIIIKSGENIVPSEIETAITQCDGVLHTKVLGAPHKVFGENIQACVVMKKDADFHEERLRTQLKTKLPSFKIPEHIFLYSQFPMNINGKINQRVLQNDMLNRIKEMEISQSLNVGISVAQITIKNTMYNVVPVTAMISSLMKAIGFDDRRVSNICLATEEMLLERISNAFEDVGDILIEVLLYSEWITIRFSDCGMRYVIEKNVASSYSAKLILNAVDAFKTEETKDGIPLYCMNFIYDNSFDIHSFLKGHTREEVTMLK